MKRVARIFLTGLLTVLPVIATIYFTLWVLSVLWSEEEHAAQGTGGTGRTIGSGLLICGFRVRVPGGVLSK